MSRPNVIADRERSLVAHVGRSGEVYDAVTAEGLRADHFGDPRWRPLFAAVAQLREAGTVEIRTIDLKTRLLKHPEALTAMGELRGVDRATPEQIRADVLTVIDASEARALRDTLRRGVEALEGEDREALLKVKSIIAEAAEVRPQNARERGARKINDSLQRIFVRITDPAARAQRITGIPIGIDPIDDRTRGLQRGKVVVVAARPSGGKSALGTTIVSNMVHAARERGMEYGGATGSYMPPTLFYSLEMEKDELVQCMLWADAEIPEDRALFGNELTDDELRRLQQSGLALSSVDLEVECKSSFRASEMAADIRAWHRQRWPKGAPKGAHGLVIIDYLQLVDGDDARADTVRQLTQISNTLTKVAKETGVCIVILSQLGRDSEKEGRWPSGADLKGSGAIEQDAHVIILLHPLGKTEDALAGKPWRGSVMAIMTKVRGGRPGHVPLHFWGECRRFRAWDSKIDGTYDDLMPQAQRGPPRPRKPKEGIVPPPAHAGAIGGPE